MLAHCKTYDFTRICLPNVAKATFGEMKFLLPTGNYKLCRVAIRWGLKGLVKRIFSTLDNGLSVQTRSSVLRKTTLHGTIDMLKIFTLNRIIMKVSVPNDFTKFEDPTLTNPLRTCPKPYTHVQTTTKTNCNMPQNTTHTLLLRQYAERIPFHYYFLARYRLH